MKQNEFFLTHAAHAKNQNTDFRLLQAIRPQFSLFVAYYIEPQK